MTNDLMKRQQQLMAELAAQPVMTLTGVVDASGADAGQLPSEKLWTVSFTFDAWRIGKQPMRTDPLTVQIMVTEKEADAMCDSIDADTVIKIRARVAEKNVFGSPQALLTKRLGVDKSDQELRAFLAESKTPVTYDDATFGRFTFDRQVSWYRGIVKWNRKPIALDLCVEEPGDLNKTLEVARALWAEQQSWKDRIRIFAIKALLPLKNDDWLDDDEKPVTAAAFRKRMVLESIVVYPDGSFGFYHDDGDLFAGHTIQVSGTLADGPTKADIPG